METPVCIVRHVMLSYL